MWQEGDFVVRLQEVVYCRHVIVYGDQEVIFIYWQIRIASLYIFQQIFNPGRFKKGHLYFMGPGQRTLNPVKLN